MTATAGKGKTVTIELKSLAEILQAKADGRAVYFLEPGSKGRVRLRVSDVAVILIKLNSSFKFYTESRADND